MKLLPFESLMMDTGRFMKVKFICLICLGISSACLGQKGYELGAWLGTSLYFGDLNTSFRLSDPGLAGGIIGRYNFDERISLKGSLNYGRISADDADSNNSFENERNINFFSQIFDFTTHIEFNFFPYLHGHNQYNFTPYLAAGLSVTRFNPKSNFSDPDLGTMTVNLHPLGTEGQLPGEEYARITPGLTIGGGFKFDLSKDWSINIEVATRRVLTDYLDDVSGVYADSDLIDGFRPVLGGLQPSQFADPSLTQLGEPGKQRGNARDNDSYTFIGISIMRYFGQLQCPKPSTIFN